MRNTGLLPVSQHRRQRVHSRALHLTPQQPTRPRPPERWTRILQTLHVLHVRLLNAFARFRRSRLYSSPQTTTPLIGLEQSQRGEILKMSRRRPQRFSRLPLGDRWQHMPVPIPLAHRHACHFPTPTQKTFPQAPIVSQQEQSFREHTDPTYCLKIA